MSFLETRFVGLRVLETAVARLAKLAGALPWLTNEILYRRERGARASAEAATAEESTRPLPPPKLRFSSAGTDDSAWFLDSGRRGAEVVLDLLDDLAPARRPPAVLDFGCGCGRVLRHLEAAPLASVDGVDWNRQSLSWCAEHLDFASFAVGRLEPPLPFDAARRFDLIYAFSVFTHLPAALQVDWLDEMARRLNPGGLLALSTHGDALLERLDDAERAAYEAGELVVRRPSVAGTNVCAAYHPSAAMQHLLPPTLEVVRHESKGALGNPPQDLWVLRRVEDPSVG
ncbi:MAG: class I SAM-dependent methyltransferase [Acidobacteriota bacterium]